MVDEDKLTSRLERIVSTDYTYMEGSIAMSLKRAAGDTLKSGEAALKGAKLLKEWSSWMVTVEVGTIAFVASGFLKDGKLLPLPLWCKIFMVCFGLSVATAAHLLSGLPWIVMNMDNPEYVNFYQATVTSEVPLKYVKIWMLAVLQHLFFAIGLLAMTLGMIGWL
jgi:hypothetical protein